MDATDARSPRALTATKEETAGAVIEAVTVARELLIVVAQVGGPSLAQELRIYMEAFHQGIEYLSEALDLQIQSASPEGLLYRAPTRVIDHARESVWRLRDAVRAVDPSLEPKFMNCMVDYFYVLTFFEDALNTVFRTHNGNTDPSAKKAR